MRRAKRPMRAIKRILIISQVYVPDPASVGQHMADAAEELARRGFRVRVVTSARGYDDPSIRYARREARHGVRVVRVPWASFGKGSLLWRLVGGVSFLLQAMVHGIFTARPSAILVTTAPPMGALAAMVVSIVRRAPIVHWVMDLNPDQAVALGHVERGSVLVALMEALNRSILGRATTVVVLDRFMEARVTTKSAIAGKIVVLPPWPHENFLTTVDHDVNPFRKGQGWDGKLVIMYSGNHSPSNPLRTVLEAAAILREETGVVFAFLGGGIGKAEVEEFARQYSLRNVVSLPYQPLDHAKYSLSAADVHIVTLGSDMVGIVHPCKIYGALAVARPVIFVGPAPSHASDILAMDSIGWHFEHGDSEGVARLVRSLLQAEPSKLREMGERGKQLVETHFSKVLLCSAFCDHVEHAIGSKDVSEVRP